MMDISGSSSFARGNFFSQRLRGEIVRAQVAAGVPFPA
jgi:hypothetical protein